MRSRTVVVAGGLAAGLMGGWLLAQRRFAVHRRALFDRRSDRRRAALGFLAGQGSIGTIRLLRDYLAWERQPALRRRAETIVRRMETVLR
jgi:2-polyprenyl-6-methoxyphenol hydroxylase-like FAD-dependent oxidoreductase